MELNKEHIVADIVRENYKTAQLFEERNIDFCCGGNISLGEACRGAGIDPDALIPELEALLSKTDWNTRYVESLDTSGLSDYIEQSHHAYVTETVPFLLAKLDKLCNVHGENHHELFEIRDLFNEGAANLAAHMKNEETILFPQIRKMTAMKDGITDETELRGSVEKTIRVMVEEHQAEGDRFKKISEISNKYRIPEDACNTYAVTYRTLKEFEEDLHRHIHLENNILFPAAMALEEELYG